MAHVLANELKDAVLQAAMQGKLTKQLESDSSVNMLLDSINKEKEQFIKDKKRKKEKPLSKIKEDELPFEIPFEWRWERWGNLSNSIQYGANAGAQPSGNVKLVRISDIQNNQVTWETVPFSNVDESNVAQYELNENDILFARTGGTVGKSVVVKNVPTDGNTYIFAGYLIRTNYSSLINYKFLKLFLDSPLYWEQLKDETIGSAQPNCNGKKLANMLVPLPPIEEQQRIVEKVEELMAKIDEYEKIEKQLVELKKEFPGDMRDAILQAAMEGKLTEQFRKDGSSYKNVEVLNENIELPIVWDLVNLKDVAQFNGGYAFKSTNFTDKGIRVIRISDFNETGILNNKIVRHPYYDYLDNYKIYDGDILMCMTGGTVGKKVFIKSTFEDMYTNQRVANIRVNCKETFNSYINYVLETPLIKSIINTNKNSTNDNISMDLIKSFPIPLPPIEEQQRIVEILDKLLPLCDGLV